ncbi:TAP42-like protein [Sodiomyces alkalinus F11]|uniref:TAP42-like protein n=1 Tax=Sodiomyces alkalinus (strain CBS 110278 / VKM F-3762 / F11) TaxID=1314773 RepID=A0A3N2Q184_SODAK|nr:TAP42-like protein [Sodiomyces alkalinus F11]ROT40523.1 TAP42-like protein [Sodiomyces alkalinus F11]
MADRQDPNQPRTLKQIWAEAQEKRLALENSSPITNPSYSDDVLSAIQIHEEILRAISRVSLFSPNEPLDDIATPDLPYLLANYYLAEIHQKTTESDPARRRAALSRVREAYERFLGLLDAYDALQGPYRTLYERYTDDPLSFSTVTSADPARRRDAKIANFRAEKLLKDRLATLRRDPRYAEAVHGDGDGDGDGDPASGVDDEILRELYLAEVSFAAHMAFQGLEGLNRELEVLAAQAARMPTALLPQQAGQNVEDDARRRLRREERDGGAGYTDRVEAPRRLQSVVGGPLLSRTGKPLQPFTLVGSRQEMTRNVFRPGHNLPTMSVEEYLEEERRRGGIIEGGGASSYNRPEPDEDDVEKADQETYKARAWDEFVEANPKGSGNTLNRG